MYNRGNYVVCVSWYSEGFFSGEEEHKQRNEEHFRKKAIADKAREEKEEANKPVDVVVKPVKKNKAKVKIEENEE